jgi:hypothetical protein
MPWYSENRTDSKTSSVADQTAADNVVPASASPAS